MGHGTTFQRPGFDVMGRTESGAPDYVVIDESGDFTYYSSVSALLSDMEYPGEAACVVDREGNAHRLLTDVDGALRLGRSFGPAEFSWLRQAWVARHHRSPKAHPLQRFFPECRKDLLSAMFETLPLEQERGAGAAVWSVSVEGRESRLCALAEVDSVLARVKDLAPVQVTDPFGHRYRPVRRRRHALPTAASILYVEIGPRGRSATSENPTR